MKEYTYKYSRFKKRINATTSDDLAEQTIRLSQSIVKAQIGHTSIHSR